MAQEMSIEAILSAVDQNFTKTMESAVDSLSKVVGESNQSASKFAANGAVFGASAAVTAGALGLIKNSLGEVISGLNESSATWKTFEGNMSYIGKSESQIGKVRSELTKYAQQTIYSASDMATTYSQLAAVGIKNTTKLVKGFGGLASAAENPKQAMKTLSQQATQMASKPTVQWEDFRLMLEQTPAGIAAVAKSMGLSTSQLVSDVQNGKVKTEDFFNAISKVGTNKAFTKMSTEYKTVGQAMDGLIETITTKLQPAFDALSGVGIKAISGIVNAIDNGGPAVQIITGLGIALMAFVGVLTAVGLALKLAALAEMAFNAAVSLNPVVLIIAGIVAVVAALGYFFTQTEAGKKAWKSFCDVATNAWNAFYPIIKPAIDMIVDAWNGLVQAIQTAWQMLQPVFSALWQAFQAFMPIIKMIAEAVGVVLVGAIVAVVYAIAGLITGVMTIITTLMPLIQAAIGVIQAALSAIMYLIGAIVSGFAGSLSGLVQIAQSIWDGVVAVFQGGWQVLKGVFDVFIGIITGDWTQAWNGIKQIFSGIWASLSGVAQAGWGALRGIFNAGVGFIKGVMHFSLSAEGEAIMNSLLGGLKRAWESVKSFVSGIGKWIKAHKGPISVDRRLLIPAGHAIMNGLGNGLVDGFSDVQKSVLAMNKQITDAMQPDVSGFANRLNGMASDVQSRFAGSLTMQDSTLQMQNNALLRQIAGKDTTMILDSGALVGATAGSYDQRLGQRTALKGRWS
ncbi:tape measure domain-containing protein [Limosilactobacillus mucosae]|nr:tape measure protein [Limosilactobacillus mucosae]SDN54675.1 tape measure domain-containing protein [Limosilactobacillus mucosae]SEL10500.1 tape measure domain-containing protein [Limosilactobacillus mucosae]SFK23647.1 tape measure domain-containing protein [Limosilactobacillus mucosae]